MLVTPFKGERTDVLAFIENVNTAFEVTVPRNATTFYKFVLTGISGKSRRRLLIEIWKIGEI
jgi:hypothetical protein